MKAHLIHKAIAEAEILIKLSDPKMRDQTVGEPERQKLLRFYLLEYTKRQTKQKRLHQHLLYAMLFNLPQNELINRKCWD